MRHVRERGGNAELVLAGYPDPRHTAYHELLLEETRGLSWASIVESPTEDELVDLYDRARVYAHPRIGEHFGIAPVEAMSRGAIPVVRSPTGLSEVVSNGVEAFVEDSDIGFVRRMSWLLEASGEELSVLESAARRKAGFFKPEKYVSSLLGELRRAASKH